jgi:parallel beta-helix repeat protein
MAAGRYGVVGSPLFWKPGVSLYGGFAGNETSREQRNCRANVTYLSTSLILAGYTASTTIDGFTIYREVTCDNSSPTFTNNIFSASKQYSSLGSAILTCKNASPLISNNVFYGRTVGNMSTFINGAGIVCENGSAPVIRNNILAYGSGISCTSSSPQIINNTIVGNALATLRSDGLTLGTGDGAAIRCFSASPVISNNIIAYNSTGIYTDSTSLPVLKNNCIYRNWKYDFKGLANPVGKDGNVSSDPVLVSWEYGNLHIQPNSPCKDAGDDGSIEADWLDVDLQARVQGDHVDIGADESDGTTWPDVKPRIVYVKLEGADTNDGAS